MAAVVTAMTALALAPPAAAEGGHSSYDVVITNPVDGHQIHATVFRPAAADVADVPMVLHSHGWAGSRSRTGFEEWLDAGYGVLSFDQRGFGESTDDKANIEDPAKEGRDVITLVDHVAALDWVAHDQVRDPRPRRPWDRFRTDPTDPVLFAIGGSYGGGYQFAGAFADEAQRRARGLHTRFNALAPEITWFDLNDSLAPQDVPRSVWGTLLTGAGAAALPDEVLTSYATALTTGHWPRGVVPGTEVLGGEGVPAGPDLHEFMRDNGPRYWVEERGIQLDIPMVLRQGATDNLFNLNQGISNFQRSLTDGARARSLFVGYNGGHALPNALPAGFGAAGDPCSGEAGFGALSRGFFDAVRAGRPTRPVGFEAYNIATATGGCIRTGSLASTLVADLAPLGAVATTTGVGAPVHLPIATGPLSLAGVPRVTATLTTVGIDARAFVGLAVGTSPADARVVQNNVLPIARTLPTVGEAVTIELPGIAVEVPEGQTLFLTVSPVADLYAGVGSRVPGILVLDDVQVHLPVQP